MKKSEGVTIALPAYNEAKNIEVVVKSSIDSVKKITKNYEILIVDDGSSDSTAKIADELANRNKHIKVVHHTENKGFTGAIRTAFSNAKKDLVFLAPADGQFDFSQLRNFTDPVRNSDIVLGYRVKSKETLFRKAVSKIFHLLCRILLGIPFKEISSVSLWRRKVLRSIRIESDDRSAMMLPELVYKAIDSKYRFSEVPIYWQKRKGGNPKGLGFSTTLKTAIGMVDLSLHKIFPFVLLILVFISYGQLLFMQPWQEDNVIFFKIANIEGPAGFMGKGVLGEGPYRHTAIPYYLLYRIFGYNIPVYYGLMLLSYFFATVSIYYLVKEMLDKKAGMIASFLFGAGYVASEGFIRVYTSTVISSGIAFTSLLFLTFWKYYKSRELKYYFLTVFLYWATIQVSYVRAHYLILPLLVFDFLFLVLPKLSNIKWFSLRTIPFVLIFYKYYVLEGDTRSKGIREVMKAVLSGKFEYTHSFLGSLGNLIVPDFLQKTPVVLGIVSLLIVLILLKVLSGQKKKIFALFSSIAIANLASYAIYTPLIIYPTNYRYLAHSFFALCVILSLFALSKRKIIAYSIIGLGFVYLFYGVNNQRIILRERSQKIATFYQSLKSHLPEIPKGSIIYFDIQDSPEARQTYAVSFSVAEMPETTAIAWRYGIDRYDFEMVTNFKELTAVIKKTNVPTDKIFTFWISKNGLVNTTDEFRKLGTTKIKAISENIGLPKTSNVALEPMTEGTKASQEDLIIEFTEPITSVVPLTLSLDIKGVILNTSGVNFPIIRETTPNPVYKNISQVISAFDYQKVKNSYLRNASYTSSSEWKERILSNINDGDPDTVWQADRILWNTEKAFIKIDLKKVENIAGVVWINGFSGNTPGKYRVETSMNGIDWIVSMRVNNTEIINTKDLQVVKFEPVNTRFTRLSFEDSLNDSPAIAELWPISSKFKDFNLQEFENFVEKPLQFIADGESYFTILGNLGYSGKAKLYWMGNQSEKWMTTNDSVINISYDNKNRIYNITVPPSGTKISKLKISDFAIPGSVILNSLTAGNIPILTIQ